MALPPQPTKAERAAARRVGYDYALVPPSDAEHAFRRAARSRWINYLRASGTDTWLRLGVTRDGRYAVTGVVIGLRDDRAAIPARALRTIPVGKNAEDLVLMFRATWKATALVGARHGGRTDSMGMLARTLGSMSADFDPNIITAYVRRGREPLSDSHLRTIAQQYREADRKTGRPMVALKELWPAYSMRALKHWVRLARDRGLLAEWVAPKDRRRRRTTGAKKRGRNTA